MQFLYGLSPSGKMIPLLVDASNNLRVNVSSISASLIVIGQGYNNHVMVDNYGNIGTTQQKDPLRIGYHSTVYDAVVQNPLPAGASTYQFATPAAGEVHVITNMAFYIQQANAALTARFEYLHSPSIYPLFNQIGVAANQVYDKQGEWYIYAGDQVQISIGGAVGTNILRAYIHGFKFYINQ